MSPKAFFLSIALLLSSAFCVFAQESAHLKFKGIPIDGNYKVFAQELVNKGFQLIESTKDDVLLKGTFMAIPNVTVYVIPDPTSNNVANITAMIETGSNWQSIERDYYTIVNYYKEKYGEPTSHKEEFVNIISDSDYFRLNALREGRCNYTTIWEQDEGRILIYPFSPEYDNYYIICRYEDELNNNARHKTIIDDI